MVLACADALQAHRGQVARRGTARLRPDTDEVAAGLGGQARSLGNQRRVDALSPSFRDDRPTAQPRSLVADVSPGHADRFIADPGHKEGCVRCARQAP
jgi:hypothetical protein